MISSSPKQKEKEKIRSDFRQLGHLLILGFYYQQSLNFDAPNKKVSNFET